MSGFTNIHKYAEILFPGFFVTLTGLQKTFDNSLTLGVRRMKFIFCHTFSVTPLRFLRNKIYKMKTNLGLRKILRKINFNFLIMTQQMRNVGTQDREKLFILFPFSNNHAIPSFVTWFYAKKERIIVHTSVPRAAWIRLMYRVCHLLVRRGVF